LKYFDVGKPLGKGKFGSVYLAKYNSKCPQWKDQLCAIKVLFKNSLVRYGMQHQLRREIEIMTKIQHEYVIQMHGYFWDAQKFYLVIEFAANGELYKDLMSKGSFDDCRASTIIYELCDALSHLHANDILHRDIKPENILVGFYGEIKLADFGWSAHSPSNRRATMCGTLDYLPPEMVNNREYAEEVDAWAVGILCYELLYGKPPFERDAERDTKNAIAGLQYSFPSHFTPLSRDLISKILVLDQEKRLNCREIQEHTWTIKNARPHIFENRVRYLGTKNLVTNKIIPDKNSDF